MDPITSGLLIGGGTQLLSGILGGFGASQAGREKRRALNNAMGTVNTGYDQALGYQQPFYDQGIEALNASSALAGRDIPTFGGYNEPLNVDKFLDPSMDYQIQRATDALGASFLGQGTSKSGAASRALMEEAQKIAGTGYQTAVQNAMADRGFDYNAKMAEIQSRINARNQQFAELSGLASMGANAGSNMSNLQTSRAGQIANMQLGKGEVNAQMSALPFQIGGNILNTAGQMGSGYFGAMKPSAFSPSTGSSPSGILTGATDLRGGFA